MGREAECREAAVDSEFCGLCASSPGERQEGVSVTEGRLGGRGKRRGAPGPCGGTVYGLWPRFRGTLQRRQDPEEHRAGETQVQGPVQANDQGTGTTIPSYPTRGGGRLQRRSHGNGSGPLSRRNEMAKWPKVLDGRESRD